MSKVLTAIDKSGSYRLYLTISTDMAETAREIHQTTPLAAAGLGRVLTGAGLMGLMLKNPEDKLTLIFQGDGPARQILATADGAGNVKGYIANPHVDLPLTEAGKLDVGGSLGTGQLTVIKDLGLREPYVGKIQLVSGEIAEDLAAYYYISEQQNSAVALGVKIGTDRKVACSGGMIVQVLPDAQEEAISALEAMIGQMKPITTLVEEAEASFDGVQTEEARKEEAVKKLLGKIFQAMPEEFRPEILEIREMGWKCDCSRERLEQVLMTIGSKDLREIIEEDGKAQLVCQFCRKEYNFEKEQLERILAAIE